MHATKTLPTDYHQHKLLDLSSTRAAVGLNLAAVPLLFLFGWLFYLAIRFVRSINPFAKGTWNIFTSFSVVEILAFILSVIFILIFHELIHGAFFWLFTGEQPRFALKAGYAFAAAPDWCLPRAQYVVVGLSPLIFISILSVIIAAFVPASIVPYIIYIATFNAAGALGDMIVVAWVLRQSPPILVQDQGDKFITFSGNRP